jgi:hypothetical protein
MVRRVQRVQEQREGLAVGAPLRRAHDEPSRFAALRRLDRLEAGEPHHLVKREPSLVARERAHERQRIGVREVVFEPQRRLGRELALPRRDGLAVHLRPLLLDDDADRRPYLLARCTLTDHARVEAQVLRVNCVAAGVPHLAQHLQPLVVDDRCGHGTVSLQHS